MEVAAGYVCIAIGSVCLIHIVVSVLGEADGRVVDIGKIPLGAFRPVRKAGVIVRIGRGDEVGRISGLLSGERHLVGIDGAAAGCHHIGLKIIFGP